MESFDSFHCDIDVWNEKKLFNFSYFKSIVNHSNLPPKRGRNLIGRNKGLFLRTFLGTVDFRAIFAMLEKLLRFQI